MGDFPMMTERGTFIINGTERVVVSQLVRSPGRLLQPGARQDHRQGRLHRQDHPQPRGVARVRRRQEGHRRRPHRPQAPPERHGAPQGARLDRGRDPRRCSTSAQSIQNTLEKDHVETQEEALEDIYRKLRPGEPPTAESARTLLENLFFNPKRYDLARVGRYKVDKKLEAAEGVLAAQLKARFKQLAELDNPDKKAWEQPKFRVWAELQKDEQGENGPKYKGILHLRGHAQDGPLPREAARRRGGLRARRHRPLRQPPPALGGRADPEPDPDRPVAHGARRPRAHDHAGRRGDHAADADQHPPGRRVASRSSSGPRSCRSSWTRPTRSPG